MLCILLVCIYMMTTFSRPFDDDEMRQWMELALIIAFYSNDDNGNKWLLAIVVDMYSEYKWILD